jgi:hypothetical protein
MTNIEVNLTRIYRNPGISRIRSKSINCKPIVVRSFLHIRRMKDTVSLPVHKSWPSELRTPAISSAHLACQDLHEDLHLWIQVKVENKEKSSMNGMHKSQNNKMLELVN